MRRTGCVFTGNRTDAEDVVGCALRACAIQTNTPAESAPWLLSIVRNTAHSWLRKNRPTTVSGRRSRVELERPPGDSNGETPEAALIAKSMPSSPCRLRHCRPVPRNAVLRDVEGLDYREIAEATEVPIVTRCHGRARSPTPMLTIKKGR